MTQNHALRSPPPARRAPVVALALIGANVVALGYASIGYGAMRADLAGVQKEVVSLRHAIDLYRYERTSQYDGLGYNALLDHLTRWAPELQKANRGTASYTEVEARVRNIVETMGQLPGIYPQIEASLRDGGVAAEDPATDDEIRKWLLQAAQIADPEKTAALYANLARAEGIDVSSRLRRIAIAELAQIDKKLTGEILHKILTTESGTGVGRPGAQGTVGRRGRQPQFYNFIEHYVATGHPKVESTLQMILGRPEHDEMTLQAAAVWLGKLKCTAAEPQLMKLYEDYRSLHLGRVPNPLVRRKAIDALVEIKGPGLREFLRKIQLIENDPGIQSRLAEIKTEFPY